MERDLDALFPESLDRLGDIPDIEPDDTLPERLLMLSLLDQEITASEIKDGEIGLLVTDLQPQLSGIEPDAFFVILHIKKEAGFFDGETEEFHGPILINKSRPNKPVYRIFG